MESVYQHAPEAVREVADRVVPAVRRAAASEEVKRLHKAGGEAVAASVAAGGALWEFFEPALAGVVREAAGRVRARRSRALNAVGAEAAVVRAVDNVWQTAEKHAPAARERVSGMGWAPKKAADSVAAAAGWVARSSKADAFEDEREAKRKAAQDALSKPRASAFKAADSEEGRRLRAAGGDVMLAMVVCVTAVARALVPLIIQGAGSAAAATGYEAKATGFANAAWNRIECASSNGYQYAKEYKGPGSLTLLQLTEAFAGLVEWLKDAAKPQVAPAAEQTDSTTTDNDDAVEADSVVATAEVIVPPDEVTELTHPKME